MDLNEMKQAVKEGRLIASRGVSRQVKSSEPPDDPKVGDVVAGGYIIVAVHAGPFSNKVSVEVQDLVPTDWQGDRDHQQDQPTR